MTWNARRRRVRYCQEGRAIFVRSQILNGPSVTLKSGSKHMLFQSQSFHTVKEWNYVWARLWGRTNRDTRSERYCRKRCFARSCPRWGRMMGWSTCCYANIYKRERGWDQSISAWNTEICLYKWIDLCKSKKSYANYMESVSVLNTHHVWMSNALMLRSK